MILSTSCNSTGRGRLSASAGLLSKGPIPDGIAHFAGKSQPPPGQFTSADFDVALPAPPSGLDKPSPQVYTEVDLAACDIPSQRGKCGSDGTGGHYASIESVANGVDGCSRSYPPHGARRIGHQQSSS